MEINDLNKNEINVIGPLGRFQRQKKCEKSILSPSLVDNKKNTYQIESIFVVHFKICSTSESSLRASLDLRDNNTYRSIPYGSINNAESILSQNKSIEHNKQIYRKLISTLELSKKNCFKPD